MFGAVGGEVAAVGGEPEEGGRLIGGFWEQSKGCRCLNFSGRGSSSWRERWGEDGILSLGIRVELA